MNVELSTKAPEGEHRKYYGFQPAQQGEFTYGIERIADIEDEVRVLHDEHYNETETLYLDTPFSPSYDRYRASEEAGQFVLFTARVGSALAANLQYYVFNDMHTEIKVAREDAFFVSEPFRGRKIAPSLLAYAEDALRQLGCVKVGMSSKAPVGGPDIGPFLEKRDYKPVAIFYMKDL